MSPETTYQALYVQGRGHLRADLHQHPRTDPAIPGYGEGDLILGSNCRFAIATLVKRQTRFAMLVHLPNGHGAITVRDGLLATIKTLPKRLRKTLTWDQGTELAQHKQITMVTKMAIYFCDPHSPWQRGSNENTNGLLEWFELLRISRAVNRLKISGAKKIEFYIRHHEGNLLITSMTSCASRYSIRAHQPGRSSAHKASASRCLATNSSRVGKLTAAGTLKPDTGFRAGPMYVDAIRSANRGC